MLVCQSWLHVPPHVVASAMLNDDENTLVTINWLFIIVYTIVTVTETFNDIQLMTFSA